ncbi:hypothetical protein QLL95_gp0068 [Cotonvirus japonicus]|uniref:F-box domain-containing protein n=1 Tax=Cotonvirus japonicus TaxID=2811091 RepID=A0ABM7NR29_9VIRU|nr:hypothetical protein QLL95_gp0068 [Cotonvirus japonicus]BCS82557.1 hypothetical protein [Cotonvirus japonicus]
MQNILDFPLEIVCHICNYLDEIDFIYLTQTCQGLQAISKIKSLNTKYLFSKASQFGDKYLFTNIIVDIIQNVNLLDTWKTNTITLHNDFNGDIEPLYALPKLKTINIGTNFTHIESIKNIPDNIINKKSIILHTIANIVSLKEYENDLLLLNQDDISKHPFPGYLDKTSINMINEQIFLDILKNPNVKSYHYIMDTILRCFKPNMSEIIIGDLFKRFDIFDKYKIMIDIAKKYKRSDNLNEEIVEFIKTNTELITEFVEDLRIIYDFKYAYLSDIYQRILKKYNFKNMLEYIDARMC